MSNQKLGILAVAAAVMVLLAVVTSRTNMEGRKLSGPAHLIQGLDTAVIDHISVGEGKDLVTIRRQGSQFVVGDINYPADPKQINDLINKSLDIKTVDLYTSDPKNHDDLEVSEAKARSVVKFFKADGSLLTGVMVGKTRETGQGTFVRRATSDDVYLAEETPWYRTRALDYVNQEIASIKSEDVNAVTVTTADGSYTLKPAAGGGTGVVMDGLPADKKLKESDARSVLTALQGLRFDDVNTPSQITGLVFDHKYVARMDDSTEYTLELAKKGDKTYLKALAAYMSPQKVTINPGQKDSPEELKKKEAILLAQEGAQRFSLRHKAWIYEIPDWKAKNLIKPQAELLEDKEKAAEATSEAGPPVGPDLSKVLPPAAPNEPATTPLPAEPNK